MAERGLKVVSSIDSIKDSAIVISSHGISPEILAKIKKKRLKAIDTTCPFVLNAQRIAKSLSGSGYRVIIVGEASHPEVKALVGFVPKGATVVKDAKDAKRLKINKKDRVSIISQTTQSADNFLDVVKEISKKTPKELKVVKTICKDVEERQKSARALARIVDAMLIVGGRNSANTKRLFEISKRILNNSHLIETEKEINTYWFRRAKTVGITSGASTPDWIVKRVVEKIRKNL